MESEYTEKYQLHNNYDTKLNIKISFYFLLFLSFFSVFTSICCKKKKYNIIKYNIYLEDKLCSICLENFNNKIDIVKLQCDHYYHYDCINKWNNNTCPECRGIILI